MTKDNFNIWDEAKLDNTQIMILLKIEHGQPNVKRYLLMILSVALDASLAVVDCAAVSSDVFSLEDSGVLPSADWALSCFIELSSVSMASWPNCKDRQIKLQASNSQQLSTYHTC